jgi:N-acetylglucosamine kinase-like BadF-type ATPase
MKYVLSIDCGGSKISCLALDHNGNQLSLVKAGSDGFLLNENTDLSVYEQVISEVTSNFSGDCSAVFCNTGGFPPQNLKGFLRKLTGTDKVKVVRESTGELIAMNAPLWNFDIAVMAGTGSVAVGVAGEKIVSTGGWGWIIDDLGSGFALGRDALRAATGYADGKYQLSGYIAEVLKAEAITTETERAEARNKLKMLLPDLDRQRVASLAPIVMDNATKGDPLAKKSVEDATEALTELAVLTAERLQVENARIAAIGGLFSSAGFFRDSFNNKISNHGMKVIRSGFNLLKGAAVCALIESGIDVNQEIIKNINRNNNA